MESNKTEVQDNLYLDELGLVVGVTAYEGKVDPDENPFFESVYVVSNWEDVPKKITEIIMTARGEAAEDNSIELIPVKEGPKSSVICYIVFKSDDPEMPMQFIYIVTLDYIVNSHKTKHYITPSVVPFCVRRPLLYKTLFLDISRTIYTRCRVTVDKYFVFNNKEETKSCCDCHETKKDNLFPATNPRDLILRSAEIDNANEESCQCEL